MGNRIQEVLRKDDERSRQCLFIFEWNSSGYSHTCTLCLCSPKQTLELAGCGFCNPG